MKEDKIKIKELFNKFVKLNWKPLYYSTKFDESSIEKVICILNMIISQALESYENSCLRERSIFTGKNHDTHKNIKELFTRNELSSLVTSGSLCQLFGYLAYKIHTLEDRIKLKKCVYSLTKICKLCGNSDIYEQLSICLLSSSYFEYLIYFLSSNPVTINEYAYTARMLELCASTKQGIRLIRNQIYEVLDMIIMFTFCPDDVNHIAYPAATVLLDLTADHHTIDLVADYLKREGLYHQLFNMLNQYLSQNQNQNINPKLRDLLTGILLNLTCNIEDEEIIEEMMQNGSLKLLVKVLWDIRVDWPTNGSILALLQYAHMSLSSHKIFQFMSQSEILKELKNYAKQSYRADLIYNVNEIISILEAGNSKGNSVLKLRRENIIPAAA